MKRTILFSLAALTVILALNFGLKNDMIDHSVQVCFRNCPGVEPPNTKVIITDADGNIFGDCTLVNRECCKVTNVPNGIYHIRFTQDSSYTFCDTRNFTVDGADRVVYIPCWCK